MSRPTGVTILAILHIIGGIVTAVVFLIGGGVLREIDTVFSMFTIFFEIPFHIMYLVIAVMDFVIAGALFSGKSWGRLIVIIFSILGIFFGVEALFGWNPIEISFVILDAIVLWYVWRPHVREYFKAENEAKKDKVI